MKKIVLLLTILIMMLSASACTSGSKQGSATATDITPEQLQEIMDQAEKDNAG